MELTSLKNYKSAFSFVRGLMIVVVIFSFIVVVSSVYLSYRYVNEHTTTIWALDPSGNILMGKAQEDVTNDQRVWEYKNHIKMFYNYMYSFDQYSFKNNIEKGLHLIGNSGKEILSNYQKQEISRRLKESNVKVNVQIENDSIVINFNKRPYEVIVHALQTFEAPTGKSTRRLYSQFVLMDLDSRSAENPHKVLIDQFIVTDDSIIE